MATKERQQEGGLLTTPVAAERLGIKLEQFRRLAKRLGIEPEDWYTNPHYRSGPECPLWAPEAIDTLAASSELGKLRDGSGKRQDAARKAVASKRAKLDAYVESVVIDVPQLPREELIKKACENYNDYQAQRACERRQYDFDPASPHSNPDFIERIAVNYLRHRLTCYERHLAQIAGKVGCVDAYTDLKEKGLDAIADAYPWLAEECHGQARAMRADTDIDTGRPR